MSGIACPCCDGTGVVKQRVSSTDEPNEALQNAFALVSCGLGMHEANDRNAHAEAEERFGILLATVMREEPAQALAELAGLAGSLFAFIGEARGRGESGSDMLRALAGPMARLDWCTGLQWPGDD